jgi:hypothetical protein
MDDEDNNDKYRDETEHQVADERYEQPHPPSIQGVRQRWSATAAAHR